MEQNVQVIAKKAWHIVKVAYFLLRKNISKRKLLLLELKYLATKRPKLTHHKNHHRDAAYEFSCSTTPCHHKKSHARNMMYYDEEAEREIYAVNRVLDMMLTTNVGNAGNEDVEGSLFSCSPVLPGFGYGRSPMVRQLRVTDSPYLLQNCEDGEIMCNNYHVDEAAEEFIKKFYDQLQKQ